MTPTSKVDGSLVRQLEHFAAAGDMVILEGLDRTAASARCGNEVVKVRVADRRYAQRLTQILRDVHSELAPAGLAPRLIDSSYDEESELVTTRMEYLEPTRAPSLFEIGTVLAMAHTVLRRIPDPASYPWLGFYGEVDEFRALVGGIHEDELRGRCQQLLGHGKRAPHATAPQYVHRDLHIRNVLGHRSGTALLDWDMAHAGYPEDDLAMAICCLAAIDTAVADAAEIAAGYQAVSKAEWADPSSPVLRAAIAIAGLRQGVGGWYSDGGEMSAGYWPGIRHRVGVACRLVTP